MTNKSRTNKLRVILFFSMFLTFTIHSAAIKQPDQHRPTIINNNITVTGTGTAASATTAESTSLASNTSKQYVVDHKIDFGIISSLNDLVSKSQSLCECSHRSFQSFSFPGIGKYKLCAMGLFSSYAFVAYKLHLVHQLLESCDAWCNWKEVVTLSHLVTSPYEDTVKQLQIDIAKKCFSLSLKDLNQNGNVQFMQEVQGEINLLKNYLWWSNIIKTLYCANCFYMCEEGLIQEKLARLNFMVDIFIKWQVERNDKVLRSSMSEVESK